MAAPAMLSLSLRPSALPWRVVTAVAIAFLGLLVLTVTVNDGGVNAAESVEEGYETINTRGLNVTVYRMPNGGFVDEQGNQVNSQGDRLDDYDEQEAEMVRHQDEMARRQEEEQQLEWEKAGGGGPGQMHAGLQQPDMSRYPETAEPTGVCKIVGLTQGAVFSEVTHTEGQYTGYVVPWWIKRNVKNIYKATKSQHRRWFGGFPFGRKWKRNKQQWESSPKCTKEEGSERLGEQINSLYTEGDPRRSLTTDVVQAALDYEFLGFGKSAKCFKVFFRGLRRHRSHCNRRDPIWKYLRAVPMCDGKRWEICANHAPQS